MGERVSFRCGEIWFDDELGIVRVDTTPNCMIDLEAAKEEIAIIAKLSKGKRLPLLCDMRMAFIDQQAREYYGSAESRAVWRAVALLGQTPQAGAVSTMWTAAYDHPDAPSRVYFSEPAAIDWLKGFVNKGEGG
jgi:hypothetical protein